MQNLRRPHNAPLLFTILAVLYLVLSLVVTPIHSTEALYHLNNQQYRLLIFLVATPVVAIWFVAFYGYAKIKEYAALIADAKEGQAFEQVANGMMWLAWGLPIPSIITTIVNAIANSHPGFHDASIIISEYANLAVPLVAFHILSTGSRALLEQNKLRISANNTKLLVLGFVIIGSVYCYKVFDNLHSQNGSNNIYGLPHWLVLVTLIIPYLYAWFLGLLAAYEMLRVSTNSPGLLYRRALQLLAAGLGVTVAASIGLQYLRAIFPHSGHVSLSYTLLLVYMLLIIIAIGYALLAAGAKRLKRIEEV